MFLILLSFLAGFLAAIFSGLFFLRTLIRKQVQKNEKEMKLTPEQLLRKYLPQDAVEVALSVPPTSPSPAPRFDPFGGADVYIDGFLELSDERGRWHRRWVVLRRGILVIFPADETKGDPELMVQLDSCTVRLLPFDAALRHDPASGTSAKETDFQGANHDGSAASENGDNDHGALSKSHSRRRSTTRGEESKRIRAKQEVLGAAETAALLAEQTQLLAELQARLKELTDKKRAAELLHRGKASTQQKKLLEIDAAESPFALPDDASAPPFRRPVSPYPPASPRLPAPSSAALLAGLPHPNSLTTSASSPTTPTTTTTTTTITTNGTSHPNSLTTSNLAHLPTSASHPNSSASASPALSAAIPNSVSSSAVLMQSQSQSQSLQSQSLTTSSTSPAAGMLSSSLSNSSIADSLPATAGHQSEASPPALLDDPPGLFSKSTPIRAFPDESSAVGTRESGETPADSLMRMRSLSMPTRAVLQQLAPSDPKHQPPKEPEGRKDLKDSDAKKESKKLKKLEEAKRKQLKKEVKEAARKMKKDGKIPSTTLVSEDASSPDNRPHSLVASSASTSAEVDPKKLRSEQKKLESEQKKLEYEQKKLETARLKQIKKEEKTARNDERKQAALLIKALSQERHELKKQIKLLESTISERSALSGASGRRRIAEETSLSDENSASGGGGDLTDPKKHHPAAVTTSTSYSLTSSSTTGTMTTPSSSTSSSTTTSSSSTSTTSTTSSSTTTTSSSSSSTSGRKHRRSESTDATLESILTVIEIIHPNGAAITFEMPMFGPDKDKKVEKRKEKEKSKTLRALGLLGKSAVLLHASSVADAERWSRDIRFFCEPPGTLGDYHMYASRFTAPLSTSSVSFEQCHWFNIFLTRYWKDIVHSAKTKAKVHEILAKKFSQIRRPSFIGPCVVEAVGLGEDVFTISRVRLLHTDVPDELIGELDIVYNGGASLVVTTEVKYSNLSVGVYIFVKCLSLRGTLTFYGAPTPGSRFSMAFTTLPEVAFDVKIQLGNKKKVQITDYAKVRNFIISVLEKLIWKNVVVPNKLTFGLPLPGTKLAAKTVRLASRRTREDRAMDFAAEIASMDRARQYLRDQDQHEQASDSAYYSYLYPSQSSTSTSTSTSTQSPSDIVKNLKVTS